MDLTAKKTSEYRKLPLEEALKSLETSSEGLKEAEARKRIDLFGYNEIV